MHSSALILTVSVSMYMSCHVTDLCLISQLAARAAERELADIRRENGLFRQKWAYGNWTAIKRTTCHFLPLWGLSIKTITKGGVRWRREVVLDHGNCLHHHCSQLLLVRIPLVFLSQEVFTGSRNIHRGLLLSKTTGLVIKKKQTVKTRTKAVLR